MPLIRVVLASVGRLDRVPRQLDPLAALNLWIRMPVYEGSMPYAHEVGGVATMNLVRWRNDRLGSVPWSPRPNLGPGNISRRVSGLTCT